MFLLNSFLYDFSIFCDGDILVGVLEILLDLFTDELFFFVFLWKFIDELVEVLGDFFLIESFQVAEVSVLNFHKVCSVAGIVTVVGKDGVDGLVFESGS